MNRRNFFGGLLKSVLVSAVAPNIILAAASDRHIWKPAIRGLRMGINPAWISAPYECWFLVSLDAPKCAKTVIHKRGTGEIWSHIGDNELAMVDPIPMRFSLDRNGVFVPVPPYAPYKP